MDEGIMKKGAVLSKSVAQGKKPILFAERSEAVDDSDSGWQFLAGQGEFLTPQDAQIWAIDEVIEHDPSIAKYVNMPFGTKLVKGPDQQNWHIATE